MVFYLLIGTVSIVGNLIVLFVVYKSKQLRHSQYVYKCSIAISDIIWGFSISSFFISISLRYINLNQIRTVEWYDWFKLKSIEITQNNVTTYSYELKKAEFFIGSLKSNDGMLFWKFLYYVLSYVTPITLFVSFISLVFASIDRYIALTFPFKYKKINSIKKAKKFSVFIWFFSAFINIFTVILGKRNYNSLTKMFQPFRFRESEPYSLNQNITAAILFTLFCLLWIMTSLTLCSLNKSYKRSLALSRKAKSRFSLEKQMSLVLVFMVVAFTFSFFPTIYLHVCLYLYNEPSELNYMKDKSFLVSVAFLTTNSVWNIIIYNFLNKKFRRALMNVFSKYK